MVDQAIQLKDETRPRLSGMRRLAVGIGRDRSVRVVQKALIDCALAQPKSILDALDTILAKETWRRDFDSFPEFVIALPPLGLGVHSQQPLKFLGCALLAINRIAAWTEVVERVAREPGRPRKTLVNSEGFVRFYTIPTAATSRDRLLVALKRHHPQHFQAVCALECSVREAGIRAGLIRATPKFYGGVCDIAAAAALTKRAQARLLGELFRVMTPDAQCTFIAREIEPWLEAGMASRWRDRSQPSGS
jgi:hypothetical protein